jgi:NAD-dependent dihydropyrimidine dehydrogenase PreA subunit
MTLVICHCVHRRLPDRARLERLRTAALAAGARVVDVGDLCAAAAEVDEAVRAALAVSGTILAGCHTRALAALARRLLGGEPDGLRCVDLRAADAGDPLPALGLAPATSALSSPCVCCPSSDAWYPLIDGERCTKCGSCQSFCLFGVYARNEAGAVCVQRPLNCKLDCPACARICPENAIVFPKCTDSAINGAACSAEDLRGARIRLSPDEVFGGDLKARLAARHAAAATPLFRPGVFTSRPSVPPDGGSRP